MSFRSTATYQASVGATDLQVGHSVTGSYDKSSTVLSVVTDDTLSITGVTFRVTGAWGSAGADGGFTLQGTYTAHGKTWWIYDKVCGPDEPSSATAYVVGFSAAVGSAAESVVAANIVDFSADDIALPIYSIRALEFADDGTGTSFVLPTITALGADDIWAVSWTDPRAAAPQSPLTSRSSAGRARFGSEQWRSNSPTGTRTFTVSSGSFTSAIGAIMIVGVYTPLLPTGGWGVGQVRMGAN